MLHVVPRPVQERETGHREKAAERKEEGELPGLDDDEGDVGARQTEAYHT